MSVSRRILSIGHSYVVGLNRRLAHEIAREGKGRWQITAVAPGEFVNTNDGKPIPFAPMPDEACDVRSISVRRARHIHLFTYGRELKEMLAEPIDLVHAWEEPYVLAGAQIARNTPAKVPLVFWTAQNISKIYPPPFGMLEKRVVNRCAGWLACGTTTEQTLVPRPGYAAKPHRVMPLGVDLDLFRSMPADERAACRRLAGFEGDADAPVIGFLGRFIEEKGVMRLTDALDRLTAKWRALFVGSGPLEATLRSWALQHGDRVRIIGGVTHEEVPKYLNAMDVLVAPSQTIWRWREQLGRMITEAFACGVPVVGSDSGEIPFVIGDAGVIVPEADTNALARALADLVESSPRRAEYREAGLTRVRRNVFVAGGGETALGIFRRGVRVILLTLQRELLISTKNGQRNQQLALQRGARTATEMFRKRSTRTKLRVHLQGVLMRSVRNVIAAAVLSMSLLAPLALAADKAKSYQVTGTVIEMDDKKIVVEKKDGEKWELARDAETKIDGDLKVGGKVTIHYVMVAGDVEAKGGATTKPSM